MSVRATVWAFDEAPVTDPTTLCVLLALADDADSDGGNCYPSLRRIAARARVSLSTAKRHVRSLEEAGVIVVDRPERQGRGQHNRYQLCMDVGGRPRTEGGQSEPLPERGSPDTGKGVTRREKGGHLGGTDPRTTRETLTRGSRHQSKPEPVGAAYAPFEGHPVVDDPVPDPSAMLKAARDAG